jgi:hypothetical protein
MLRPPLDPDVDDLAPSDLALTDYDVEHLVCYLRRLDAGAEGADWREISRISFKVREASPRPRSDDAKVVDLWFHEEGRLAAIRLRPPPPEPP